MMPMMGMVSMMKDWLPCRPHSSLACWLQQPEWITFAALAATSNHPAQRGHRHQPGHAPACEQHQCVHGSGRHGAYHPGAPGHGQAHPRRQGGCATRVLLLLPWYSRCSHTAQHSTLSTRWCVVHHSAVGSAVTGDGGVIITAALCAVRAPPAAGTCDHLQRRCHHHEAAGCGAPSRQDTGGCVTLTGRRGVLRPKQQPEMCCVQQQTNQRQQCQGHGVWARGNCELRHLAHARCTGAGVRACAGW